MGTTPSEQEQTARDAEAGGREGGDGLPSLLKRLRRDAQREVDLAKATAAQAHTRWSSAHLDYSRKLSRFCREAKGGQ